MFEARMRTELEQIGGRAHVRGDVVHWLASYGWYKAYRKRSGIRQQDLTPTIAAMHQLWSDRPEVFVRRLAEVVLPVGGWPVYGAHRMIHEIVGGYTDDHVLDISETALRFSMARKVPRVPWEWDRLNEIRRR